MDKLIKNSMVYTEHGFRNCDILIRDGRIFSFLERGETAGTDSPKVFDFTGKYVFPGFTDVHVHLREPGFSYKETITSGTAAAARGGFTDIFAMPNLNPVPDNAENLGKELEAIKRGAIIRVHPYGSVTVGEKGEALSAMKEMTRAIAFSDDGRGTAPEILFAAMKEAKSLGKIICSHCEDLSLKGGEHIAECDFARGLGINGISNESEYVQLEKELELAGKTGCGYHLCHASCKESVGLIREAKKRGIDVTCETAPHYFAFDNTMLKDEGRFKMNPPLRSPGDREAIIEGICDGTIDIIATDHAPHSSEEKSRGLKGSLMGVTGLETSFAAGYTYLVKTGYITLEKLIGLMSVNPKKRFGAGAELKIGAPADIAVFDLEKPFKVDSGEFLSMGKSTPFEGLTLYGRNLLTLCDGREVYIEK